MNQITFVVELPDEYTLKQFIDLINEPLNSINATITQVGIYKKKSNEKTVG